MPIYEYCCSDCGHELEVLQNAGEPLLQKCPACGKKKLFKKLSAAAFHLKGQGWYKTDFRDQKKKGSAEDKTAGNGGAGTETASTEPPETGGDKRTPPARDEASAKDPANAPASAGDASGKSA